MAYIPKEHQKYDILPYSQANHFEVFAYDSEQLKTISALTNNEISEPYGIRTYQEYYNDLFRAAEKYPNAKRDIDEYYKKLVLMNDKSQWAIYQYIGETNNSFTKNRFYYVPMYRENGHIVKGGIIDDEEFTDYIYSLENFKIIIDSYNKSN